MADDYTYSMADPEGSRESLDLTKQMLDVVREIKDIQASANSDKILQRDLTQEALEMAIEEAEIEASRAGVSKSEADIKRDILEAENLAVKLSLKKLECLIIKITNKFQYLNRL